MKRRTSTAPVRVYKYGIPLKRNEIPPLFEEQVRHAHRYRNALIAIERNRRAAYRWLTSPLGDIPAIEQRIAECTEEITVLRSSLKAASVQLRRKARDTEVEDKIKALRTERTQLKERRKSVRAMLKKDPEVRAKLDELDSRALEWKKLERAATPTFWGTYLMVEESVDQAAKSKTDPEFRGWRPYSDRITVDGSVRVQIQGGMTVQELHGCAHGCARLLPVPEGTYSLPRGRRKRASRTTLMIRVGSDGRKPVWAKFPIIMHRPLPTDAVIKYVRVKRRRIGTDFRWEALFTLEAESLVRPRRVPTHSAGVDIGWRRVEDGLRIAYVESEHGETEEVIMPMSIVDRFSRADSIRGIRTKHWHEFLRPPLRRWLERTESAPEWLRSGLHGMGNWNNPAKMTRLAYRWTDNRFAGDETIFPVVAEWLRQERHLHQMEANGRSKAEGHRREIYRIAAKRLVTKWPRLVVNGLDLRGTARKKKPEEGEDSEAARYYRFDAATGEFRLALRQAAAAYGTTFVELDVPARECHACGEECVWDAENEEYHTCEHCGTHWHADANQARKLLAAASGEAA